MQLWPIIKVFLKLHKSPLLVLGTVSGLKQILATESPWKLKKMIFYFILKVLFVLNRFKFLSYLFGHIEKTV